VYEEEVLSDTRAIWFSPDGDKIAWIEFNDTNVDVMTITHYGQPGNLQFQYPKTPKPCSAGASLILLLQGEVHLRRDVAH